MSFGMVLVQRVDRDSWRAAVEHGDAAGEVAVGDGWREAVAAVSVSVLIPADFSPLHDEFELPFRYRAS